MKILFMTLSNIGDAVLTLPVLDILRENFPEAKITVICGVRPKEIFEGNPAFHKLVVYDKHRGLKEKLKLFNELRKERYDLIVDLRNSLLSRILLARYRTSVFVGFPKTIKHMWARHLYRIQNPKLKIKSYEPLKKSFYIRQEDQESINQVLKENSISETDKIIVIAPGARSHTKRWEKEKFSELVTILNKGFQAKIILVGDKEDAEINKYIAKNAGSPVLDFSGRTSLAELAVLLKKSKLLVSNDSATLHIASYFDTPVVAIFGITDDEKYGPWSKNNAVVKKEIFCRPCEKAQCRFGTLECMSLVKVGDVLREARNLLNPNPGALNPKPIQKNYKRILIVRTDRIGDLLLSTPVIKAMRQAYPNAYITMMVSPYTKEIVEGNPYLDEVITYDKDEKHKSWARSVRFARNLKKKRFDLSIILHPTNRAHLIAYLAGIRKRVGYDRKMGFLLTDRIKYTKQRGEKHELEYNLDLLRYLNIEAGDKGLFIPIKDESEKWVDNLFRQEGIRVEDKLLIIHPGASCPSRIWPAQNYAAVADKLSQRYGFKIFILAGPQLLDSKAAEDVIKYMRSPAVNLARKTSLSQATSLIKRCKLLISADTGPVHIATAVGTPQVVIFGRNQPGLSPLRWGPTSEKHRILHKTVGCIECLAHNCQKQFACLNAITVDEVVSAADSILK
ncbi:MAG: lipopolysaccharide heptosyltransferase II [Candidatus Omnitrophica bacterium]|nr:lipopolysaccharide heptosyltransferase II [Candidatus Omnitrophota bacterium]